MATPNSSEQVQPKKGSRLLSSSTLVSAMTLLSRVLGLVRDILIAQFLGAGSSADAFFVAFKVPNFLRRLFAEGAFSQAFVPVLSEYKLKSKEDVRQLIKPVMGALGSITLGLCVIAALFAPAVVWLVAPGFSDTPDKMALTSEMMRITFPYLFFVSTMACASGVLNTYGVFAPSAFSPVLLNVTMIAAIVFVSPVLDTQSMALAWAVAIAGMLQLLLHLYYLAKIDLFVWPAYNWKHPGVRRILKLMAPAVFGVSISQINLFLDTILASFLEDGSVSWLYYADRLIELPLGIFGIAIATVILPHLSTQHASKSTKGFGDTLDWGARWVVVLGIPAAVAMVVLAEPILVSLFYYGAFALSDVIKSAEALQAYTLALLSFMLIKVFATGYFSRQDTKTPVKIGIIAMVVNMVANIILIQFFAHVGLALATALSAFINAFLLYHGLSKAGVFSIKKETWFFVGRVFAASIVMVSSLLLLDLSTATWADWEFWMRIAVLIGAIVLGFSVFIGSLFIFGVRPKDLKEPVED